jgi:small subunit ribosomal protein S6
LALRKYETIYLLRADLSEDSQKALNQRIFDIITNDEGKLLQVENWGVRKTAYPVQKQTKAAFFQITYAGRPSVTAKLEHLFRIVDEIMKYHSLKIADTVTDEELEQETMFTEKAKEEDVRRDRKDRGGRRYDRNDDRKDDRKEQKNDHNTKEDEAEKHVEA